MTVKYFVEASGHYIGAYDGFWRDEPVLDEDGEPVLNEDGEPAWASIFVPPAYPSNGIEVSTAPEDARQIWNFSTEQWGAIPPLTDYTLPAALPWARMETDEEAELVQDGVDASPTKTRNMINKAASFTTGTDAFAKFKAIIVSALDQSRADAIMGPPLASELSAVEAA